MQIVVNGRFLTQQVTGVQRYARELMSSIDEILPDFPGISVEMVVPNHVEVPIYKNISVKRAGNLRGHLWEQLQLPLAVRGNILFCPANTAPLFNLFSKTMVVTTVHDLSYKYFPNAYSFAFKALYNTLMTIIMKKSVVITVSNSEKLKILEYYPKIFGKLFAIQNGGLPKDVEKIGVHVQSSRKYILYVGSFSKRKNFPNVLRAAKQIISARDDVDFWFVGGTQRAFTKSDLGLNVDDARLHFKGQINDLNLLRAIYMNAAVFVFPSLYESSGLPPIEAMACGCPCVVSDIPALVERCGDAAIYCNPQNVNDIAEKIEIVLNSAELRNTLIQKGLLKSLEYSWLDCAKYTLNVIKETWESKNESA